MATKFYQIAAQVVDAQCSSRFVEEMLITKLCRENGVHGIDSEAQVKIYIGEIKAADEKYPRS